MILCSKADRPFTVVLIVPTGIGCAVGGYAGDALPVARAIAQVSDCLITHPNVLNGAQLYWPMQNTLYVEGYGLDQFAAGHWGLAPVQQNRIGLVLDRGIEEDLRWRHLQAADAARATLGLHLTDYVITDTALGVGLQTATSGATWGKIQHPDSLLRAVERLVHTAGAEAIAVVARFPDEQDLELLERYRAGNGVDPVAGVEAVISHLVVQQFQLPCAHAPALSPLPLEPKLSPRSAAEEIGYTFLPCVLAGLSRAPQFLTHPERARSLNNLVYESQDVDAVVIPETACGGSALLSFGQHSTTQIIAVRDNHNRMKVPPAALGIKATTVNSYLEAVGMLVAWRAGISVAALSADLPQLQPLADCE